METLSREQIIRELQESIPAYMESFDLDSVGIFEEQGEGDHYYLGYTVSKADKTYHIHIPYKKSINGELAPVKREWTVETDEPNGKEAGSYRDIESAFNNI